LIVKHYETKSPILKLTPNKKSFNNNLFFPSFCISLIFIDWSLHAIVKLLSKIDPGVPFLSDIDACHILYLTFEYRLNRQA